MTSRSRLPFLLVAVLVIVSLVIVRSRPRLRRPPAVRVTEMARPKASQPAPLLPLASGNRWTYRETKLDVGRGQPTETEVSWVVTGETRLGWRLCEERDGRSVNTFTVVADGEGTHLYEFEAQPRPLLLLPVSLKPGDQWNLNEVQRARVVREVDKDIPGRSVAALEIRFERYYGNDWTDEPGWFEDGSVWVAPGVGIVAKDLTHALRPPSRDRSTPKETWGAVGAVWTLVALKLN
jgi:hypothetical protein